MKKVYMIALLGFASLGLMAQGGTWYVGGIAGYRSVSENFGNNNVTNSWYFGPEVGTFFNANWSAGLVLGADGMNEKDDNGDIMKRSAFVPNLYVRRWWNVGERLNLFAGLDLSFGSGSVTMYQNGNENKEDYSSFGTNLNAGVAYALAQRWTLLLKFAALGYSSQTEGDNTTNTFGIIADGNITSNQFIFVGLYWSFIQP